MGTEVSCGLNLVLEQPAIAETLLQPGVNMLIRVHEESFVLFFFNSFILLDKKPFFIAAFCILSAFFIFAFMGKMIIEICLALLIFYSVVSQFLRLFSHTYEFGLRHVSEYTAAVLDEERSRNLLQNASN